MVDATAQEATLIADDDGIPLKTKLARATRRQKLRALGLVAPLVLFVMISFVYPIGAMLVRGFYDTQVGEIMHRTAVAIQDWDGEGLPGEEVWEAFTLDLQEGAQEKTVGKFALRLNFVLPGTRSLVMASGRKLKRADLTEVTSFQDLLVDMNADWSDRETWAAVKRLTSSFQTDYYANAIDMRINADGEFVNRADEQRIYLTLFWRTLWMSALVMTVCLVFAYPLAYWLSVLPMRISNLLMIMVLLPFWTSLLVRTTAWISLLQEQGIINDVLVGLGILNDDGRVRMIYNEAGTIIAMSHILLPFMILPLYSVMRTIPPSYMRAARSLGANQLVAFVKVYMPQTAAGVGAGSLLVFILSIGYYITPALVGGQRGQLISNLIANHIQVTQNWSLAAALGAILLAGVLICYWLYNKLIGADNLKLG
jgi:putative spermidine/putrescine transport system permease protein